MSLVPATPNALGAMSGTSTPVSSSAPASASSLTAPSTPHASPVKAMVCAASVGPPSEGEHRCAKCDMFGLNIITKLTKYANLFDLIKTTTNPRCKSFDHVICKRHYGCLCRRWSSDAAVKMWWTAKSDDEKATWYIAHHAVDGSQGEVRPLQVERLETKAVGVQNNDMDNYIPFKVFKRNGLMEGKSVVEIEKEWMAMLRDESVLKVEKRGAIYLYDSTVLTVNRFDKSETGVSVQASADVLTSEGLEALREACDEDMQRFKRRRDSKAAATLETTPRPLGGARGCNDLDSSLVDADALDTALADMTEQQQIHLDLIQELADIDEQDISIFRVEQADEIKAKIGEKPIENDVRKAKDKMKTFLKGAFETKVESTAAEAVELARNCAASYPDEGEAGGEWQVRLQKVAGVKESLNTTRTNLEAMITVLNHKIDKCVDSAQVESALEEFEKFRGTHYTEYKAQAEHITKMTAMVKKKEQKLRDDAGHAKKRKKGVAARSAGMAMAPLADGVVEDVAGTTWDGVLAFLYHSFATANSEVNIKVFSADLIGITACKFEDPEMAKALKDLPVLKALLKWCASQCAEGTRSAMAATLSQANHRARLEAMFSRCTKTDAMKLFVRPFSASDPWLQEVLAPQAVFYCKGQSSLALAPFGLPVAFVPVEGDFVLGGLQIATLDGETLSAKMDGIKLLSVDALAKLLKSVPNFSVK